MVMMTEHDYEEEAIEAVKKAYPESTNWQIRSVLPGFYDGALVVVALWRDNDYRGQVNVYFDEGNRPTVFAMTEDLAKALGARRPREKWEIVLQYLLSVNGVSAIVAIIVTITICVMVLYRPNIQIPDILANALTMILAFYFGTQAKKR